MVRKKPLRDAWGHFASPHKVDGVSETEEPDNGHTEGARARSPSQQTDGGPPPQQVYGGPQPQQAPDGPPLQQACGAQPPQRAYAGRPPQQAYMERPPQQAYAGRPLQQVSDGRPSPPPVIEAQGKPSRSAGTLKPSHSTGTLKPSHSTGTLKPSPSTGIIKPSPSTGIVKPSTRAGKEEEPAAVWHKVNFLERNLSGDRWFDARDQLECLKENYLETRSDEYWSYLAEHATDVYWIYMDEAAKQQRPVALFGGRDSQGQAFYYSSLDPPLLPPCALDQQWVADEQECEQRRNEQQHTDEEERRRTADRHGHLTNEQWCEAEEQRRERERQAAVQRGEAVTQWYFTGEGGEDSDFGEDGDFAAWLDEFDSGSQLEPKRKLAFIKRILQGTAYSYYRQHLWELRFDYARLVAALSQRFRRQSCSTSGSRLVNQQKEEQPDHKEVEGTKPRDDDTSKGAKQVDLTRQLKSASKGNAEQADLTRQLKGVGKGVKQVDLTRQLKDAGKEADLKRQLIVKGIKEADLKRQPEDDVKGIEGAESAFKGITDMSKGNQGMDHDDGHEQLIDKTNAADNDEPSIQCRSQSTDADNGSTQTSLRVGDQTRPDKLYIDQTKPDKLYIDQTALQPRQRVAADAEAHGCERQHEQEGERQRAEADAEERRLADEHCRIADEQRRIIDEQRRAEGERIRQQDDKVEWQSKADEGIVSTGNNAEPPVKPFTGENQDSTDGGFEAWYDDYDQRATESACTQGLPLDDWDDYKLDYLVHNLKGEALRFYQELDEDTQEEYIDLVTALRQHFQSAQLDQKYPSPSATTVKGTKHKKNKRKKNKGDKNKSENPKDARTSHKDRTEQREKCKLKLIQLFKVLLQSIRALILKGRQPDDNTHEQNNDMRKLKSSDIKRKWTNGERYKQIYIGPRTRYPIVLRPTESFSFSQLDPTHERTTTSTNDDDEKDGSDTPLNDDKETKPASSQGAQPHDEGGRM